jgi:hypothetical protein
MLALTVKCVFIFSVRKRFRQAFTKFNIKDSESEFQCIVDFFFSPGEPNLIPARSSLRLLERSSPDAIVSVVATKLSAAIVNLGFQF